MCALSNSLEIVDPASTEQISPLQIASIPDQMQVPVWDGLGIAMQYVEFVEKIANIVLEIVLIYGAISACSWLKQLVLRRRAGVATEVLSELEFFYIRLEQLVSWQYMLDWNEWGRIFNEILHGHFLPGKLKAQRLKKEKINVLLELIEKFSKELPGNQRLATQQTPQGQLVWLKEAPDAKDKFQVAWGRCQVSWKELKDKLSQEALYECPPIYKRFLTWVCVIFRRRHG